MNAPAAEQFVSLVEVAELCARQRAAALDLFEQLGSWVTDTAPGPDQRRFAAWCHRHAWHAELWAARAPVLREWALGPATDAARGRIGSPAGAATADRVAWHHAVVAGLRAELAELAERVDAELDPSTARTAALVRADLDQLVR